MYNFRVKNVYVALEDVRSLYNIGAMFRTCSFFNITNLILVGYSGKKNNLRGEVVLHEQIHKTALGSENDLNITMLENSLALVEFAKSNNLQLFSVEQSKNAIKLSDWIPKDNCILTFGNEVTGVSETVLNNSHEIIEIERLGKHHSLNVTTSCGIILSKVAFHITNTSL